MARRLRIVREMAVVADAATLRADAADPEVLRLRLRSNRTVIFRKVLTLLAIAFAISGSWSAIAPAQRIEPTPDELEDVGVDEKLNAQIPLDLEFRDENGNDITLGEIYNGQRPVLLTMNYSDCPMLCSLQLNGLVDALKEMSWSPGEEFDLVCVSIDPLETHQRARMTKAKYVKAYGRMETAAGWHFLVGDKENIQRLADTVGFRFKYIPEQRQYAHAAAAMICTPDGRVSRYMYGIQYPVQTLKLSLLEAGEGKIGSPLDQLILYCFHYDAESGRYAPAARNFMKLGGGLTLIVLLIGLMPYWIRRRRRAGVEGARDTAEDDPAKDAEAPSDAPPAGLMGIAALPLGAGGFFPTRASTGAETVDHVFTFILIIAVIFFLIIIGVMTLFVLKYHKPRGAEATKTATHSNLLEATWSIIPTILVAAIFFWGFLGYMDMSQPPANSYEIQVVAKKWSWSFTYPNGHVDNNLHVPVDRPVRLVMRSDDVIHSLYIPSFRLKMDVVPGRYNTTWFQATETGSFTLFCAEYCGTQHSQMLAKVVVHPSGEFERWLTDAANFLERLTPVEAGEIIYKRRGCAQCHSVDGSAMTGPTFKGSFGTEHALANGEKVTMDRDYIRESILEPQAKIRAGYKPAMPTYKGQLRDEEIDALIAYIKELK